MRIAWVSHSGDLRGGAERAMLAGVEALVAQGVTVGVLAPVEGDLPQALRAMGVAVHIVPYTWWASIGEGSLEFRLKRTGRNAVFTPSAALAIRRIRPDVVVTNTLVTPIGAFAARLLGIPHLWFMHEMYGADGHGWEFDLGERTSMSLIRRLSSLVLTNSETVLESYAKSLPRTLLRRIHYPIDVPPDIEAEPPRLTGPLRLLQAGRLSPGKRPEDAVRAVALLAEKGIDVSLLLMGAEDRRHGPFIHELIAELGLPSRVTVRPFTTDPYRVMADADVVVTCSRGEAFSIVNLEAMKLGRAVVAAASGGTFEQIRDGDNGLHFAVADPASLAATIERLDRDRALLQRVAANGRQWALATFSRSRYAGDLLAAFDEARRR